MLPRAAFGDPRMESDGLNKRLTRSWHSVSSDGGSGRTIPVALAGGPQFSGSASGRNDRTMFWPAGLPRLPPEPPLVGLVDVAARCRALESRRLVSNRKPHVRWIMQARRAANVWFGWKADAKPSPIYWADLAIASSHACNEQRTRSTPELLPARILPSSSISTLIVIGSAPSSAGGPDLTL